MSALILPSHLRAPRLRRKEASEYLRLVHGVTLAPATLAKLACRGGGPEFQHFNRSPLYPVTALDEWAIAKLGRPTVNTIKGPSEWISN